MKNKSKIFFTIITILWTAFIFYNSIMNGMQSTIESNFVCDIINKVFGFFGLGEANGQFVRKMAHFTEYFVLGALHTKTVYEYRHCILRVVSVPLFFTLFTAVCDETIQLFSVGRTGQLPDVLLDFSGAVVGIIITGLILRK